MKAKTIKKVLRQKVNEWLATIEDEAVREIVSKNVIITGGAIASMLLKQPVNDYDIYLKTRAAAIAVAKYYTARFSPKSKKGIGVSIGVDESRDDRVSVFVQSAGIASEEGSEQAYQYFESRPEGEAEQYVDSIISDAGEIQDIYDETQSLAQDVVDDGKPAYRPVFITTNAITLSHKIQIVLRFYGEPDQLHENYDFVHCTNYWTSWDDNLVLRPAALEALLARELRYVGSKYPICSIIRLRKFIARDWSVNAGQILKMVMQASELDLTDPEVLRDQLTGVDSAYFAEVIAKVKEADPEKVNSAYLIEIIDRIF